MNREGTKSAKEEQHFLLSPLGGGRGGISFASFASSRFNHSDATGLDITYFAVS